MQIEGANNYTLPHMKKEQNRKASTAIKDVYCDENICEHAVQTGENASA